MLRTKATHGQTMVELALIAPLFFMVIFGIIVVGIGVFYQQQLTNAAREAARFATVNTGSAQCPTVSNRTPGIVVADSYWPCDAPAARWPKMTLHARNAVFGLVRTDVHISACWSGYWTKDTLGNWAAWDQLPRDPATLTPNPFRHCTIGGVDPRLATSSLSCPAPATTTSDDMASSWSSRSSGNANQVTIYACYVWRPPLAGFLLIPSEVTLRAAITEALEYQQ